jgi:transposase-like protein
MGTLDRLIIFAPNTMHYLRHSKSFKLALPKQSLHPSASVVHIAREHGVNANQMLG